MRRASFTAFVRADAVVGSDAGQHWLAPVVARLSAGKIDRALAAGVAPWCTPVYIARARQLTERRSRRTLAASLDHLVEHADDAPTRLRRSAAVTPSRARVQQARPELLTLASRLRGDRPLEPRVVAAVRNLLTDGGSCLYTHGDPQALRHELEQIEAWIDAAGG